METASVFSLNLVKDREVSFDLKEKHIPGIPSAIEAIRSLIESKPTEHFAVVLLDNKNDVIGTGIVGIGTTDSVNVLPKDIFRFAIAANAARVILGHNHPTGDTKPSEQDLRCTALLLAAGALIGIEVLDHVIVGLGAPPCSIRRELGPGMDPQDIVIGIGKVGHDDRVDALAASLPAPTSDPKKAN